MFLKIRGTPPFGWLPFSFQKGIRSQPWILQETKVKALESIYAPNRAERIPMVRKETSRK